MYREVSRCGVGSQDAEVFQAHVGQRTVDTADMEICSTRNQFKYFPKKVMLDAEVVELATNLRRIFHNLLVERHYAKWVLTVSSH